MKPMKLTRRRMLMIRYTLLSFGCLGLLVLIVYMLRPSPEPYTPGERVEGIISSLDRGIPEDYPRIRFVDVAVESGVNFRHFPGVRSSQLPEDMGSGVAWGDYDGDGDWDLYLCNVAGPLTSTADELQSLAQSNRLYRNNGDSTFTDMTESAGLVFQGTALGAAWADFDDDWDVDLVVTTFGQILVYRNNGDGSFSEVGREMGLSDFTGFWAGASWGDYDRDGDLDLYVCGYVQYEYEAADLKKSTTQYSAVVPFTLNPSSYPAQSNLLFRNDRGRRFVEVANKSGVGNASGRSLSAAWCDFDEDGWLDLYVANDISDNVMFRNLGDGTFEDISHNAWVADYRGAMGLGVGDWDNDGDFDIFVSHWLAQENALLTNLLYAFDHPEDKADKLLFMDIADQNGVGHIALDYIGWATSFVDYNNDGRLDLFAINGSTFQETSDTRQLIPMGDLLFWNRGEEDGFFEVSELSGETLQKDRIGRGAALADYDDDGDMDLAIVNHSGDAELLRNDGGNRGNWLKVRVRHEGPNHFGLGARVEIFGNMTRQIHQIAAQPSYLSQHAPEAHFGLGENSLVESVVVTLIDGTVRTRENVAVNQTLIVE